MNSRNKLYLKVFAGMGNQLFQCATAIAVSYEYNYKLIIDDSYYLKRYHPIKSQGFYCNYALGNFITGNISHTGFIRRELFGFIFKYGKTLKIYKFISNKIKIFRLNLPKVATCIEEITNSNHQDIIMFGYFQSNDLIMKWRSVILDKLSNNIILSEESNRYKEMIDSAEVVSVHFRRGDYVNKQNVKDVFIELTIEYYIEALKYLEYNKVKIDKILVFSDDIEWVKANFKSEDKIIYMDNTLINDYEQMKLMSLCKNNIIANSTYSWWAAFMNKNIDKKVIAPKYWYRDRSAVCPILPSEWHIVHN